MNLTRKNQPDWMVVYLTHNLQDAHIVSGRLKHEGIAHHIHTEPGASAIGITIGNMGEIKVLVKPELYDSAMAVLFPDDPDAPDALPDDPSRVIWEDDENE